jgi:hypothetical protein
MKYPAPFWSFHLFFTPITGKRNIIKYHKKRARVISSPSADSPSKQQEIDQFHCGLEVFTSLVLVFLALVGLKG